MTGEKKQRIILEVLHSFALYPGISTLEKSTDRIERIYNWRKK